MTVYDSMTATEKAKYGRELDNRELLALRDEIWRSGRGPGEFLALYADLMHPSTREAVAAFGRVTH